MATHHAHDCGLHDPSSNVGGHARLRPKHLASEEAFERTAALFRVLADVARLKLLERLAEGEWCVTELADAAGSGLSTVSQQLRLLRSEGVVARRRAGKHIFYSLTDAHMRDLVHTALEHAAEHPIAMGEDDEDGR
jgi:ArsR family transcriptional regulator, lead/cadmium/zinc/bismuth-responsive transcriptional repressor